jgi:hypothetical protein
MARLANPARKVGASRRHVNDDDPGISRKRRCKRSHREMRGGATMAMFSRVAFATRWSLIARA